LISIAETRHAQYAEHARCVDSRFNDVQFVDTNSPKLLDGAGKRKFLVRRTTFAFLDVVFAPGLLVLSEAGGSVRGIDIATGGERWRYQPKPGRHVLRLGYRDAERSVLGVEWPFEKGGAKRLIRWSLSGEVIDSVILGHPVDCCFGLAGEVIVLADGTVVSIPTKPVPHEQSRAAF
jgi:hypothetical protein